MSSIGQGRELVGTGRITGELIDWKGYYGWIRPSFPVDHPDANWREGRIYLASEDLQGPLPEQFAIVSFLVYADKSGLGAMECRSEPVAAKPAGTAQTQLKAQAKVKAQAPRRGIGGVNPYSLAGRSRLTPLRVKGTVTDWDGAQGTVELEKPVEHPDFAGGCLDVGLRVEDVVALGTSVAIGTQVSCFVFTDEGGSLGAEACIALKTDSDSGIPAAALTEKSQSQAPTWGKKGKWQAWASNGEEEQWRPRKRWRETAPDTTGSADGPPRPRQRITEIPVLGEIVSWKDKVGWIKPDEPVEHPMASHHRGDIYLHSDDVLDGLSEVPVKGTVVNFHIYEDTSGLGAEECILL